MKVLILANNEETIFHFRLELIDELVKRGNVVFVSCPVGIYAGDIRSHKCELINVDMSQRGTNPIKDIGILKQYIRLIDNIKPDVVLTYTIKPNVYGGLACRIKSVPCIATITGLGTAFEKEGFLKSLASVMYRIGVKRDKYVFFQNSEQEELFRALHIVRDNTRLVSGSGVNLDVHRYEKYPDNDVIKMIFVGDVWRDKGIYELVDAFKRLSEETVAFLDIVGRIDESFAEDAKELEKNEHIHFWGRRNDVHRLISENDVLILPSYHEGLANVVLEALACGRPVIVSDIQGCNNAVVDEENGFLVQPRDVNSLYEAMKHFTKLSKEQRSQMGKTGRKIIEEKYNRRDVVNVYIKAMELD